LSDIARPLREMVRAAREERGMSLGDLADAANLEAECGITRQDVYRIETRYKMLPPPDVLMPVMAVLDLDLDEVLRRLGYR
jgi:transcriptional regulator with XRE-family HTH domain